MTVPSEKAVSDSMTALSVATSTGWVVGLDASTFTTLIRMERIASISSRVFDIVSASEKRICRSWSVMSSPFVKAGGVEAFSIAKRAARLFYPHRQPAAQAAVGLSYLFQAARGPVRSHWLAGAVWGFLFMA